MDHRGAKGGSTWLALFAAEVALFGAVFWGDQAGYVPISKTIFLFPIAWASLRLRGVTWRSAGLALPPVWPRALAIGAAAGVALFGLEFFVTQELLVALTGEYPNLDHFEELVGNEALLAIYLALNLVLAAFGEELVWRGYALPRVASFLGGTPRAWLGALVVVNVGFGLAHLYQGLTGVIETTLAGILLGALYLATGRNLAVPITAHFVSNTIDFSLIYLGLYPGVGK